MYPGTPDNGHQEVFGSHQVNAAMPSRWHKQDSIEAKDPAQRCLKHDIVPTSLPLSCFPLTQLSITSLLESKRLQFQGYTNKRTVIMNIAESQHAQSNAVDLANTLTFLIWKEHHRIKEGYHVFTPLHKRSTDLIHLEYQVGCCLIFLWLVLYFSLILLA